MPRSSQRPSSPRRSVSRRSVTGSARSCPSDPRGGPVSRWRRCGATPASSPTSTPEVTVASTSTSIHRRSARRTCRTWRQRSSAARRRESWHPAAWCTSPSVPSGTTWTPAFAPRWTRRRAWRTRCSSRSVRRGTLRASAPSRRTWSSSGSCHRLRCCHVRPRWCVTAAPARCWRRWLMACRASASPVAPTSCQCHQPGTGGAGATLSGSSAAEVDALRSALRQLLESAAPKRAAVAVGEEIAGMPPVGTVAEAVEAQRVNCSGRVRPGVRGPPRRTRRPPGARHRGRWRSAGRTASPGRSGGRAAR